MKSDRIKMLEQFVVEDPTDPFNHYALALELAKSDKQKAKEVFDQLIATYSDYVPAYYQSALLYLELNLNDEVAKIIENGITQAKKQNNLKAANELKSLLDEID
jgi:hypothetical protein